MSDLLRRLDHVAVRYVISGGSAAVVNLVLFALLSRFAPIPALASSIVASCIAFWASFFLQKYFTFRHASATTVKQLLAFLGVFLWNLGLTTLLFWLFLRVLSVALIDQFLAIAITAAFSFFLYRFAVFRSDPSDTPTRS